MRERGFAAVATACACQGARSSRGGQQAARAPLGRRQWLWRGGGFAARGSGTERPPPPAPAPQPGSGCARTAAAEAPRPGHRDTLQPRIGKPHYLDLEILVSGI